MNKDKTLYLSAIILGIIAIGEIGMITTAAIFRGSDGMKTTIIGATAMLIPYTICLWIMGKTWKCWHPELEGTNGTR